MKSDLQIDTMKLYSQVERIYNELRELGYEDDAPLDVEALFAYDQYHFHGTDAVDEGIRRAGIKPGQKMLDIGSGIGGPARYLAHTVGCEVSAVELQDDAHRVASNLTRRCGLAHRVQHIHADFLETEQVFADFDVVVSWFVFAHIPERDRLLARCRRALRPGGYLYVDDFHEIGRLTPEERRSLAIDISTEWLRDLELFRTQCEDAGFEAVEVSDTTAPGVAFAEERLCRWRETHERQIRVHGQPVFDELTHFYQAVHELFQGGHYGIAHLLARNPQPSRASTAL